jgi:hypothetical protein
VHRQALTIRALVLGGILVIAGLFFGAAPALAQDEDESVRGVLRYEGEFVEGVGISVTTEDGTPVGEAVSDAEGRWRVGVPEPGTYVVTLDVTTLPEGIEGVAAETITTEVNNTQRSRCSSASGCPARVVRPVPAVWRSAAASRGTAWPSSLWKAFGSEWCWRWPHSGCR